mgnify:CR=1 FL=1
MAALHYPRAVVDTALYNRNNKSVVAGDIVFVERTDPNAKRRGKVEHAQNIRVYTMAQVNAKFANRRIACVDGEPPTGHELFHEFSIDGVVHSVDEEPQEREDLGQFTIAQTAVHGACRMTLSAEDAKHVKKGFSIHIGVHVTRWDAEPDAPADAPPSYKFELFQFMSPYHIDNQELRVKLAQVKAVRSVGCVEALPTEDDPTSVTLTVDLDPLADMNRQLSELTVASWS